MKASDYVIDFLADQGIRHAFLLTGGAVAHLVDSVGRSKKMDFVCVQHEQAGAMAAEGYARVSECGLGLAMATSGPGATNLLTGIACAWFDSIPVVYITGQVNTFESRGNLQIRQMGFQETDIVSMAKPITKWSEQLKDIGQLKYKLQEAIYNCRNGRPGPVLLDIPFNFQTADVDPEKLVEFNPDVSSGADTSSEPYNNIDFQTISAKLSASERPVILVGGGVRCANAQVELTKLIQKLSIPVVCSWSGRDLVAQDNPMFRGQIGVYGGRAANFTIQNADFILSIGSRLDSRQTGGKYLSFGRAAYKVIVDVDSAELNKSRVKADLPVICDAKVFLTRGLECIKNEATSVHTKWSDLTFSWTHQLPTYDDTIILSKSVNPYRFFNTLSDCISKDALMYVDTGATLTWVMQAIRLNGRQRLMSALGNSPMGYALPAAIGAAFARKNQQIISINGDGGYQLNIQELQTIKNYNLPIKVIILNNRGYGIIKQFQGLYLDSREYATGEGYSTPNFSKLSSAYGIDHIVINNDEDILIKLNQALDINGPAVIEVCVEENQKIEPKLAWGKPIEDQLPFLPREEFSRYLLVEEFESNKDTGNEIN